MATQALEGIALSSPKTPGTPSSQKRHISPSAETSASKRILLLALRGSTPSSPQIINVSAFSQTYIPKGLFPAGTAKIEDEQDTVGVSPLQPRHIILPFDLRKDPEAWHLDTNSKLLISLFPGAGVGFDGWCLIYWLNVLPPKPWPKTIAGVPCYFTVDKNRGSPFPPPRPAHWSNPSIGQEVDGRNLSDWDQVFQLIRKYFDEVQIPITEVQYWDEFVRIVLRNRNTDTTKLPKSVANVRCHYLYEDEMGRPEVPQARRLVEPEPANPDESEYNILRPGVRLASDFDPSQTGAYLKTSAGILVRDREGNTFMTCAAHGFPRKWGSAVYHPSPSTGQSIGELVMEIAHTDIALVKLNKEKEFVNETFESNLRGALRLQRLLTAKRYSILALDSPDTGFIEGTLAISAKMRVPVDDPLEPEQEWICTTWVYTGQGMSKDLPDGICGSAIWDEDGTVVGFFRYAPKTGVMTDWCAGIAAKELIERGFTIVQ
ncbi:hypothetical protein OIDMADRAFT_44520 [Oidiodendron maius Zn]|uniref:Uncharacterized protein n=1 Tax=Oidiodendron maius (strain Zn) TaxID=913774 RepID=A0A0C3H1D1_OIDMZ|nr:hypothetical protein OIDMADRAFT_44520 [Oidiodendron maius Zn]